MVIAACFPPPVGGGGADVAYSTTKYIHAENVSFQMVKAETVAEVPVEGPDLVGDAVRDWARERPSLDTLPLEIFARLGRTHRLARQQIERSLQPFDLNVSAMDVLLALRRAGQPYRLTPGGLAEVSLLTSGGVTFRLDKLDEAGLIRRIPSTEDRRIVWAELTDKGLSLADDVLAAHVANERRLLDGMRPEELQHLRELLRRLESSIVAEPLA